MTTGEQTAYTPELVPGPFEIPVIVMFTTLPDAHGTATTRAVLDGTRRRVVPRPCGCGSHRGWIILTPDG